MRNFQVINLCEHEHIRRFSNLHECNFKCTKALVSENPSVVNVLKFKHNYHMLRVTPSKTITIENLTDLD